MAKRKRRSGKLNLSKGQCKVIDTPGGKRKICRMRNGKVLFRKMSYKPR